MSIANYWGPERDQYEEDFFEDFNFYQEEMMDTEWKDVKGFPGYYVSMIGDVMHYNRIKKRWTILKNTKLDREGHVGVALYKNGKVYYRYTHRLVAEAFLDNPNKYPIVRHLNDHPDEPDVMNLAWGTQKDNWNDSVRNGHYRPFSDEDHEKAMDVCRKPVITTELKTGKRKWFRSMNEAVRYYGVHQANAVKVAYGQRPHTCGIHFEYDRRCDRD